MRPTTSPYHTISDPNATAGDTDSNSDTDAHTNYDTNSNLVTFAYTDATGYDTNSNLVTFTHTNPTSDGDTECPTDYDSDTLCYCNTNRYSDTSGAGHQPFDPDAGANRR